MKNPFSSFNTRGMAPAVLGAIASVLFVAAVTWAATTINNNVNTGGTLTVSGDSTLTGTTTAAGGIYASSTVFTDGIFTNTRTTNIGAASGTPTTTFNVTGSGYFTSGLGIGYATSGSVGDLLVSGLAVVQSTGRLGVGTTSPVTQFGVTGSGLFSSGLGVGYATTGSGDLLISGLGVFQNTGRLGYASTSPYNEIGFAGDVAVGGALGTSTVSLETTTASSGGCLELRGSDGKWAIIYVGSAASTSGQFGTVSAGGRGIVVEYGTKRCQAGAGAAGTD